MALNTYVGAQIRKARRLAGLTQKQLGEKLGKSAASVAYLEQGKRRVSPDFLQDVAHITGYSLSFFYEKKENIDLQLLERFDHLKTQLEGMASHMDSEFLQKTDFDLLFEQAADAMVLIDLKGKILAVNNKEEELLGWKKEDVLGKAFYRFSFFPLKRMPQLIGLFHKMIKDHRVSKSVRMWMNTASGESIEVEIHSSLLKKNDSIWALMSIIHPIKNDSVVLDDLL